MTINSLGEWLQVARLQLSEISDTAGLDAQLIAVHVLNLTKTSVIAHPETRLTLQDYSALQFSLQRLFKGEALAYVLGKWEFYGHEFILTPDVLIPRPETELLVEYAIKWVVKQHKELIIADVGTGSGCICISIALEIPNGRFIATDISTKALAVAKQNVDQYRLNSRVDLVGSDLLAALKGQFDLICANLPYIPTSRLSDLKVSRQEPRTALDGGPNGFSIIRRLLEQAEQHLKPKGALFLEIDETHNMLLQEDEGFIFPGSIQVIDDLSGKPRLLQIEKASSV